MSLLFIENGLVQFEDHFELRIESLSINEKQHTVVLGPNGSGKSALAAMIAGVGDKTQGRFDITESVAWVSVAQQQALIEAERQKDSADILDVIPTPSSVEQILLQELSLDAQGQQLCDRLLTMFSLQGMLQRPFSGLSTGETRKLLLTKAIISQPKLLILDEPYDGLDDQSRQNLAELLTELSNQMTILFVLNRISEVPAYCQQLILMEQGSVQWLTSISEDLDAQLRHIIQLKHLTKASLVLPAKDSEKFTPQLHDRNAPLIELKNGKIHYGEQIVFDKLNWTVMPNHHWQISGPNGSGKTCLLNLITGDHPQCYSNDLYVFGFKRGSGESIWQIKQFIGYVSNGFHLEYRVNCSVLHVVLSGFYDSIGLYQQPSPKQRELAKQWLALMAFDEHVNTPFQQLSFGDQRLVLIARAMVKHPAVLILDEPCNGLDDINRLKVLALIELLAREGSTTVLYVNHHQEDVIPSVTNQLLMTDFNP